MTRSGGLGIATLLDLPFVQEVIAETVELIENGAPNIVCAPPSACSPNHVTGTGISARPAGSGGGSVTTARWLEEAMLGHSPWAIRAEVWMGHRSS